MKNRKNIDGFCDMDYICCQENGRPYYRCAFKKSFHALTDMCGLRYVCWHDLRHMYSSVAEGQ